MTNTHRERLKEIATWLKTYGQLQRLTIEDINNFGHEIMDIVREYDPREIAR